MEPILWLEEHIYYGKGQMAMTSQDKYKFYVSAWLPPLTEAPWSQAVLSVSVRR